MLALEPDRPPAAPSSAPARDRSGGGDGSSELISWFTSLPGVSQLLGAITTFNIGPVTELLESAGYLPLLIVTGDDAGQGGAAPAEAAARRFEIATRAAPSGRLVGFNQAGEPAARVRCRWRVVPDDFVGRPGERQPLPPIPLTPHLRQRIEVVDWEVGFRGGVSGYRAYGAGHTLPGSGGAGQGTGLSFVLDVLEGYGQFAGLAGTVVASGTVGAAGGVEVVAVTRMMDPAGGAISSPPLSLPAPAPGARNDAAGTGPLPGVTYLAFLGQVDPQHPTTLRLSFTEGFLGSNVYELLRVARLDLGDDAGTLRAGAATGPIVGSVGARLSFDPVSLCPTVPVQTRRGVFELHDPAGRSLGTIWSDMTEGRGFPTGVPGRLLPFYRFGGFGPIGGGTGEFAGARGIMTLNAVISVQPRTLSNLYVLRLDDPDGRYGAAVTPAPPAPPAPGAGRRR